MVQFRCQCGRMLQASEENAGQNAQCPACGAVMPSPSYRDQPARPVLAREAEEEDDRGRRRGRSDNLHEPPPKQGWGVGLTITLVVAAAVVFCALPVAGV